MAPTALLDACAQRPSIFMRTSICNGAAVVGGNVLLRLEKSDANDRIHEIMNDDEQNNNDAFVVRQYENMHATLPAQMSGSLPFKT